MSLEDPPTGAKFKHGVEAVFARMDTGGRSSAWLCAGSGATLNEIRSHGWNRQEYAFRAVLCASALVAALICMVACPSLSSARVPGECHPTGSVGRTSAAKPLRKSIKLQAVPQAVVVNLGARREEVDAVFKLTSKTPLPRGLKNRLEPVADPILRVGDTTNTATFPEPRFSKLSLSQNRKTLRFRVCFNPENRLDAGKYVGTINIEGPPKVASDTMTVTANAKDGGTFFWSAGIALFLAFVVLLYKGSLDRVTRLTAAANALPEDTEAQKATKRTALVAADNLVSAFGHTCIDVRWLVPTVAAIVAAFGALWAIYDANPAWGDAGAVTSGIAVIGAGLSAIGAKTIFAGGR